jgi:hypothetical protein
MSQSSCEPDEPHKSARGHRAMAPPQVCHATSPAGPEAACQQMLEGTASRLQVSMEQGGGPNGALGDFSQGPLSYPMPAEHQVWFRGTANSTLLRHMQCAAVPLLACEVQHDISKPKVHPFRPAVPAVWARVWRPVQRRHAGRPVSGALILNLRASQRACRTCV